MERALESRGQIDLLPTGSVLSSIRVPSIDDAEALDEFRNVNADAQSSTRQISTAQRGLESQYDSPSLHRAEDTTVLGGENRRSQQNHTQPPSRDLRGGRNNCSHESESFSPPSHYDRPPERQRGYGEMAEQEA